MKILNYIVSIKFRALEFIAAIIFGLIVISLLDILNFSTHKIDYIITPLVSAISTFFKFNKVQ